MKASDNLFRLIKSLTQTEKAYFKNYATKHFSGKKNIYLMLFETIGKQKKYDENKIIRQSAKVFPVSRLSKEKNYLYHLILKILRLYHANQSVNIQLNVLLADVEILYDKALFKQCIKQLKKAKKMAYRHEKYLEISEILKWEEKLYFSGKEIKYFAKPVLEEGQLLKKIENSYEYAHLLSKVLRITREDGLLRNRDKIKMLSTIINHPLLSAKERALSADAKSRYYHIYSLFYQATGDMAASYRMCKQWVESMESNPEQIIDAPLIYISSLNNLLLSMDKIKQQDEFMSVLKKIKTMPQEFPNTNTESIKAILFMRYFNHLSAFYNHTGNFEKTIALIPKIETWLLGHKGKTDKKHKLSLYLYIAGALITVNNYSKALDWLTKILEDEEIHLRYDIHSTARILKLIIHYELSRDDTYCYDSLENLVKSTYRFLAKRGSIFEFESVLLDFFRKELFKTISSKELIEAFKKLRKRAIRHLKKEPVERKALEYFDFISWLESKFEDMPVREIIERKAGGR